MDLENTIANPEYVNPYFLDGPAVRTIALDCDYILVRRGDNLVTWEGMGAFEDYESDEGFATEDEAIADAEKQLTISSKN